jgi:hypothetical protein
MLNAEHLMLVGGVGAFLLTLNWVRNRDLREKYAVVWMAVATLLLICGLFPDVVMWFAGAAHLSYPAAVLFVAVAVDYVFSFTVSVSLTRRYWNCGCATWKRCTARRRRRRRSPPTAPGKRSDGSRFIVSRDRGKR